MGRRSRLSPPAATIPAWGCARRRLPKPCWPSCLWITTCAIALRTRTSRRAHRTLCGAHPMPDPARKEWSVAVLGATGLVGEMMLKVLEERQFPVREVFALASDRSRGKTVQFDGRAVPVMDAAGFDFSRAQLALFSAGAAVAAMYAPKAGAGGCVVIDNTSQFRYEDDIPLVVPEVNPDTIAQYRSRRIIAHPN